MFSRKKIVLLSNNFPPIIDGVGDYTFRLGKELSKEDDVFYINRNNLSTSEWDFKAFIKAFKKIKEVSPHLVSLQYVPYSFHKKGVSFKLVLFWLFLKLQGFNLQITFHEISIAYNSNSLRQCIGAFLQKTVAKLLCKLSDHVFTSTLLYCKMLKKYTKKVTLVHIGSNINPVARPNNYEKKIITCFANRLNFDTLRAIANIKRKGVPLQLIALGKVDRENQTNIIKEATRLGISEDIIVKSDLSENEFSNHLSCGQIYLQLESVNKKGEGGVALKSGALAAAMAFGKAIITTKGTGTDREILKDKELVFFCENTVESIEKSILTLYHQDQVRFNLAKNSLSFHKQFATWAKIASAYKQIL